MVKSRHAPVAQQIERFRPKEEVAGAIPARGALNFSKILVIITKYGKGYSQANACR